MIPAKATKIRITTGARFHRKSPNPRPAAEPMRMLGGSPIRVAVPPMLDARICADQVRGRRDPQAPRDRERHGRHQHDRGDVVQECRDDRSDEREDQRAAGSGGRPTGPRSGSPATRRTRSGPGSTAMIIIPTSRKMTLRSIAAKASSLVHDARAPPSPARRGARSGSDPSARRRSGRRRSTNRRAAISVSSGINGSGGAWGRLGRAYRSRGGADDRRRPPSPVTQARRPGARCNRAATRSQPETVPFRHVRAR